MGEERIFWPNHFERHVNVIIPKIRKFILGYKLLENFLSLETNPDDEESLEFYSDLYNDMSPLLTEITCYLINNGYSGKRRRVDESIRLSQKILGLLKLLDKRYVVSITSQDPISDSRWYQASSKSNREIVEEISILTKEMYSLHKEIKGWVIAHPFSFKE